MHRLTWSEILFVFCFLAIAVGGGLLWPSDSIVEAILVLVAGTVLAIVLWLSVVFLIVRWRARDNGKDRG